MNLHIKQRTLERLRMPALVTVWNGTGTWSGSGTPIWRALQGVADRNVVQTVPAFHGNTVVQRPDPNLELHDWLDRNRDVEEIPINDHFDDGFGRFLVATRFIAILGVIGAVTYALLTTSHYLFRHEHKTSGPLPAAQAEKGELAR